jgi:hypothetical protein
MATTIYTNRKEELRKDKFPLKLEEVTLQILWIVKQEFKI